MTAVFSHLVALCGARQAGASCLGAAKGCEPPAIRGNGNDGKLLKLSLKTCEMTAVFNHLEPLCGAQQAGVSSSAASKDRETSVIIGNGND